MCSSNLSGRGAGNLQRRELRHTILNFIANRDERGRVTLSLFLIREDSINVEIETRKDKKINK